VPYRSRSSASLIPMPGWTARDAVTAQVRAAWSWMTATRRWLGPGRWAVVDLHPGQDPGQVAQRAGRRRRPAAAREVNRVQPVRPAIVNGHAASNQFGGGAAPHRGHHQPDQGPRRAGTRRRAPTRHGLTATTPAGTRVTTASCHRTGRRSARSGPWSSRSRRDDMSGNLQVLDGDDGDDRDSSGRATTGGGATPQHQPRQPCGRWGGRERDGAAGAGGVVVAPAPNRGGGGAGWCRGGRARRGWPDPAHCCGGSW
jgi:hypothetical protein